MYDKRLFQDCTYYSEELGNAYRCLYQLKASGANKQAIAAQKAQIKSGKRKLKNVISRNEANN